MFFIHGGAYAVGSGSEADYGPELLLDKDVVLVTINYRLGPFGNDLDTAQEKVFNTIKSPISNS